jgi:hypothetical protein
MRFVALAGIPICACLPPAVPVAYSAQWTLFAKTGDALVYLDLTTYRRAGTTRSGWTRETFFRPVTIPGTRKQGDMRDVRFVIDCATRSKSDGEYNFYLHGAWLDHGWGTPDVFSVPRDGSVDEMLVAKLCR